MKDKFRIVESDRFYIQRKTKLGWRYEHDDEFQEGWQGFFVIGGLVCVVGAITSIILNIIFYAKGKPLEIPLIVIFSISTILMFLGAHILQNCKRVHSSTIESAKNEIDNLILVKEIKMRDQHLKKLAKKKKIEARKNKKIHYLDIKTERKEKLLKLK